MIYRIYDRLAERKNVLTNPANDCWDSFKPVIEGLAKYSFFSEPHFLARGLSLCVTFVDEDDTWLLEYDEERDILSIHESSETDKQDNIESWTFSFN